MLEVFAGFAAAPMLTQRAHFWLRIVGLAVILSAQFGPRLWSSQARHRAEAKESAVAATRQATKVSRMTRMSAAIGRTETVSALGDGR
jgi:hypothetical protein